MAHGARAAAVHPPHHASPPALCPPATLTSAAAFSHCRLCVRRPMPPPMPPVPPIAAATAEVPLRPSCRPPLPLSPPCRLVSCDCSSGSVPSAAACFGARQAAHTTLNTREMGLHGGAGGGD